MPARLIAIDRGAAATRATLFDALRRPLATASTRIFFVSKIARLLDHLGYLGRAESRVTASLISDVTKLPPGFRVSTQKDAPDDQPVRLLASVSKKDYESLRNTVTAAPSDLLAALQVETSWLQENRWSAPPGSRALIYWIPAKAMSSVVSRRTLPAATILDADTALFALATDRKRDVLPLMERTLPVMELFRRALLAKIGDEQLQGCCPELTGKDECGLALRNRGHVHAHFIPLSLESRNRGRIDHILVHAPMGFGPVAQRALRTIRKTWAKDISHISVTLVGVGSKESFVEVGGVTILELGTTTIWKSRTPFIFPRHLKSHGANSAGGQIHAELDGRALPSLSSPPAVALPTGGDSSGNTDPHRFRHFVRRRRSGQAAPPTPGAFHVVLTFEKAVSGPVCIGWGSHFGLGMFVPSNSLD